MEANNMLYSVISLGDTPAQPAVFLKNSQLSDINPMQNKPIPEDTYLIGFTNQPAQKMAHSIAAGFSKVLWNVPKSSLLPEHILQAKLFGDSHRFKVWMLEMLSK